MANFGRRLTQGIFRSSSPPAKGEAGEDEKVEAYLAKWLKEDSTSLSMGGLGLTRFPPQLLGSSTLQELVFDDNAISSFPSFTPVPAARQVGKGKKSQKKFRTSTLVKFGKSDHEKRRTMTAGKTKRRADEQEAAATAGAGGQGESSQTGVGVVGYRKLATSLETLILSRNQLVSIDGGFKEALCLFSARLKKLDLSQNPIEDPVAMLEFISQNLGALESLSVSRIDLRAIDEKSTARGPKWFSHDVLKSDVKGKAGSTAKEVKKHSSDPATAAGLLTTGKDEEEEIAAAEEAAAAAAAEKGHERKQQGLSRSRSLSAGSMGKAAAERESETAEKKERKRDKGGRKEEEKESTGSEEDGANWRKNKGAGSGDGTSAKVEEDEKKDRDTETKTEKNAGKKTERDASGLGSISGSEEALAEERKARSATADSSLGNAVKDVKTRPRGEEKVEKERRHSMLAPCTSPLCLITCGEKVAAPKGGGSPASGKDEPTARKREARKSMQPPTSLRKNSRGKRRSLSSSTEYKATKFQRNLKELVIKECHLSGFPMHLPKLTVLTRLDISYNYIHVLPEEIGMLKHLTHLTLIACSCAQIPASLGKLTLLEELYLDFNSIREFPAEAAAGLVSLRQLFLPNNNLTEIPKCLVDFAENTCLPQLEFLDLNGNPVAEECMQGTPLFENAWAKVGPPPGRDPSAEPAIVRFTPYTEGKVPSEILAPDPANTLGGLYLGCGLCAQNKHILRDLGIKYVLTMARGMAPVYPVEFSYMNVEVEDAEGESLDKHLEKVVSFIENSRNIGGVLVHCSAGVSRSSSVVIAYLMQSQGMSYDAAHEHVLERRPIVKPNPGFVQQLRLFEKALNSKEQCIIS